MSLAHRNDLKAASIAEGVSSTLAPAPTGRVVGAIDFRHLARKAAFASPGPAPVPSAAAETGSLGLPPRQAALELLTEVSSAIPAILARCQSLEAAVTAAKEKGRSELEAANEVIREWQGIAETMRVQLEAAEKSTAALRGRAEAAEAELAASRTDIERVQQAAAEAECLSSLFQEKVISTFGVGSAGHTILESVRNRTQQMLTA